MKKEYILNTRVISKKNNRRNYGHISLPSEAFVAFQNEALYQLKPLPDEPLFTDPVKISLFFELKGKLDSDIDNLETSVFDVLQEARILKDDKLVWDVVKSKRGGFKDFKTLIVIEQL